MQTNENNLWKRLLDKALALAGWGTNKVKKDDRQGLVNEKIPGALDLGIYHSPNKDELQVAKISASDRATHVYVTGATGTGKTKFLECLIRQDIENGNGLGVIDPHGDLVEDLKAFLAYRYHSFADKDKVAERVVLVDPADPRQTVTFNPLEKMAGVSAAEQAGELVATFRKIWADSWGARMEDLMRNSLIALGEAEMTLCELPMFLTQRAFREAIVPKVENPVARNYFARFDTMTDRGQTTWIEPVMNKVNAFLADERIRQMFASPKSSFNIREIMDSGKCLLVKLDKGKLKDSGDLVGSLFMAKIQLAAFSRSGVARDKRKPFYLYIDEFQNFATGSFKVILSEARKYGLSLTMAHQSLSQISDELKSLILGNAGIQVYFRVNRQDAQLLAKELFQYSGYTVKTMSNFQPKFWSYSEEWEHKTEELQYLEPRRCYAKHKIRGGVVSLYTMDVEPAGDMLEMGEHDFADLVASVPIGANYLHLRSELLSQLQQRVSLVEEEVKAKQAVREAQAAEAAAQSPAPIKPTAPRPRLAMDNATIAPEAIQMSLPDNPTVEREHRRLQHLIKQLAEKGGYRAIIEQPTDDGQGRVDVAVESDGRRIACEVSVTTTPEQELANIRKCLASGYETVVMCSPQRKSLERIRSHCASELSESDGQKVLFLEPSELVLFFEEEAARSAGKIGTVKGYKVKLNYQPLEDTEKKTKRQAVARVILQSFRRQKKEE